LALSAWKQFGNARWSLRCNPSSGNLHPTETYLIASGVEGMDDGVYHYRADEHGLEQRCRLQAEHVAQKPLLLLAFSSVHWREAWKYGERAFRYCQLDTGHALGAVNYAAATLGWRLIPHYEVGDGQLATLLGLDRDDDFGSAERESPELLLQLSPGVAGAQDIPALLSAASAGSWTGQANVLDPRHFYEWPVIDEVASVATRPTGAEKLPCQWGSLPSPASFAGSDRAADLFRRRRSAQAFDGSTEITKANFYRLLDHLLPRAGQAPWEGLPWNPSVHLVLFVHRVEGLAPGLYALPRRREVIPQLKAAMREEFIWESVSEAPEHLPFFQLVGARAEKAAAQLSCHQPIAADSAFSLGMLVEFGQCTGEQPWRYRELFWEAGAVGQALYLEAEASGLSGTGIGCFFDDGVHQLLGISDKSFQSFYHFTVGGPLYDNRIIGLPPYRR
ncbi:MAG: SagB/ThcOx family dehydrogenase, partial [Gammaproteobacteria bacterium]